MTALMDRMAQTGREKLLLIESEKSMETFLDFLSSREKPSFEKSTGPYQTFPFGSNRRREGHACLFEDIENTKLMKVASVRKMLKDLDEHYGDIFRQQANVLEEDISEKRAFFNSDLLYLIAATDGYEDTLGHPRLVASYTTLLAKALGIEDINSLIHIERSALLHDIGKIGIPEFILRKAGPLTEKEREIIKEHPLLGYDMIEEFDFLRKAAQVVLFHHERFDGGGYPYGLAADEIPLEARIFALADTLDAITSDRPYRKGKSFEEVYKEIEKGGDSQFDPLLVDVFLSIPKEKWQQIKASTRVTPCLLTIH